MKTKGFIFTIDAVFSLIVAGAAIGILFYAHFTEPASYQTTSSQAASIAQVLLQTRLSALSSVYAGAAANTSAATNAWASFAGGGPLNATVQYGPGLPTLLWDFEVTGTITTPVTVGQGILTFGAGSSIYILNATTGSLVHNSIVSGNVLYPTVYNNYVIFANSTGYLTAMETNGNVLWRSASLPGAASTPLSLANGYVAFGAGNSMVVASPLNGSIISTQSLAGKATTPAYGSGELAVSTTSIGSQNYLYGFTLAGSGVTQLWKHMLLWVNTTNPSIVGNTILVGSGAQLVKFTTGGTEMASNTFADGNVSSGGSISGGNAYYSFQHHIWEINISCLCGVQSFNLGSIANVTPTTSQTQLYAMPNRAALAAYSTSSGRMLWSTKIQGSSAVEPQDIPVARGIAYVTGSNWLYAFGSCSAPGSDPVARAALSMYLEGQGGCAAQILNSTYASGSFGVFINGSYAPSLKLPSFDGVNSSIVVPDSPSTQIGAGAITVIGWVYINAYNTSPGAVMCVVCKWGFSPNADDYLLGINSSGRVIVALGNGINPDGFAANAIVPVKSWHQVGLAYNGSTEFAILDGRLIEVASVATASTIPSNPPNMSIGALSGSGAPFVYFFNGTIADVQLYSGMLNRSQISSNYLGGIGMTPLQGANAIELKGWYPLEGNANDYSGYGSAGYASNVAYSSRPFTPVTLLNSYVVSASSSPQGLEGNSSSLYNVSVVVWR